jgi:EAL domain-containing protein (putative c-di-GMP-specific phosphodiesterase class I)
MPYFQPIVAIDTGDIYAYEVLGRYIDDDGSVQSLGPFFSDKGVPNDDALAVDRCVRKQALKQYALEGYSRYLFINLRLEWVAHYADRPNELPTVAWANKYGVDTNNLVMEIAEEEFYSDDENIIKIINYYKSIGCRIAVDGYGKQAGNFERLAMLSPDILKIDMEHVHKCEHSNHYLEYMHAVTAFAKRVGIEVLYEGIETQTQLDVCIDSNGRYYQGFLLARPQPAMLGATVNYNVFAESSTYSIMALHERATCINSQRVLWDRKVEKFLSENKFTGSTFGINEYLSKFITEAADVAKRIYVCNKYGEQLSHNIELYEGNVVWNNYTGKNWAWRGFFQETATAFDSGMKSYLTEGYHDATTNEKIYTYAYRVNAVLYLFIDLYQRSEPI